MNNGKLFSLLLSVGAVVVVFVSLYYVLRKDDSESTAGGGTAKSAAGLHLFVSLSSTDEANLRGGLGTAPVLDFRNKTGNYTTGGVEVTLVSGTVAGLPGYTKFVHTLAKPVAAPGVFVDGKSVDTGLSEPVASGTAFWWFNTPLFVLLTTAAKGDNQVPKHHYYFANVTAAGTVWTKLELSPAGAALTDVQLRAKLDEVNGNLGNVLALDVGKTLKTATGSYDVGVGGNLVTVALARHTSSLSEFVRVQHKPKNLPFKLGRFVLFGTDLEVAAPANPATLVSVHWFHDFPLLVQVDHTSGDPSFFSFNVLTNSWRREPVLSSLRGKLNKLKASLGVPVTLDLSKRSESSVTYKSGKVVVTVSETQSDATGFKKFAHRFPAGAHFAVGYSYNGVPQAGLPSVRLFSASVYWWDTVPVLLKLTLSVADGNAGRNRYFSNDGSGVWTEKVLADFGNSSANLLAAVVAEQNKLAEKSPAFVLDLGAKANYLTKGKVVAVTKRTDSLGSGLEGFEGFVHAKPDTTAAFELEKLALNGKDLAVGPSDALKKAVARVTVFWFYELPLLVQVDRSGTTAEAGTAATSEYFSFRGLTGSWVKANHATLSTLLTTAKNELGGVTLDVGKFSGNYKTSFASVVVDEVSGSGDPPHGFSKFVHKPSLPLPLKKLKHFDVEFVLKEEKTTAAPETVVADNVTEVRAAEAVGAAANAAAAGPAAPAVGSAATSPKVLTKVAEDSLTVFDLTAYFFDNVPLLLKVQTAPGVFVHFKNNLDGGVWVKEDFADLATKLTELRGSLTKVVSLDVCKVPTSGDSLSYDLAPASGTNNVNVTLARDTSETFDGLTVFAHRFPESSSVKLSGLTCNGKLLSGVPVDVVKTTRVFFSGKLPVMVLTNSAPKYYYTNGNGGLSRYTLPDNKNSLATSELAGVLDDFKNNLGKVVTLNFGSKENYAVGDVGVAVLVSEHPAGFVKAAHALAAGGDSAFTVSDFTLKSAPLPGLPVGLTLHSAVVYFDGDKPLLFELKTRSEGFLYFVHTNGLCVEDLRLDAPLDDEDLADKLAELKNGLENVFSLDVGAHANKGLLALEVNEDLPSEGFSTFVYTSHNTKYPFVLNALTLDGVSLGLPDLPSFNLLRLSVFHLLDTPVLLHFHLFDHGSVYFRNNFNGGWDKLVLSANTEEVLNAELLELKEEHATLATLDVNKDHDYNAGGNRVVVLGPAGVQGLEADGFKYFVHKLGSAENGFKVVKVTYNGVSVGVTPPAEMVSAANVYVTGDLFPLLLDLVVPLSTASGSAPTVGPAAVKHHYFANNGLTWVPLSGDNNASLDLVAKLRELKAKFAKALTFDLGNVFSFTEPRTLPATVREDGSPVPQQQPIEYLNVVFSESTDDVHGFSVSTHTVEKWVIPATPTPNTGTALPPAPVRAPDTVVFARAFVFNGLGLDGVPLEEVDDFSVYWWNDRVPGLLHLHAGSSHKYFHNLGSLDNSKWALFKALDKPLEGADLASLLGNLKARFVPFVVVDVGKTVGSGSWTKYLANGFPVRVLPFELSFGGFKAFTHVSSSPNHPTFGLHKVAFLGTDVLVGHNFGFVSAVSVFFNADDVPLLLEVEHTRSKKGHVAVRHSYFENKGPSGWKRHRLPRGVRNLVDLELKKKLEALSEAHAIFGTLKLGVSFTSVASGTPTQVTYTTGVNDVTTVTVTKERFTFREDRKFFKHSYAFSVTPGKDTTVVGPNEPGSHEQVPVVSENNPQTSPSPGTAVTVAPSGPTSVPSSLPAATGSPSSTVTTTSSSTSQSTTMTTGAPAEATARYTTPGAETFVTNVLDTVFSFIAPSGEEAGAGPVAKNSTPEGSDLFSLLTDLAVDLTHTAVNVTDDLVVSAEGTFVSTLGGSAEDADDPCRKILRLNEGGKLVGFMHVGREVSGASLYGYDDLSLLLELKGVRFEKGRHFVSYYYAQNNPDGRWTFFTYGNHKSLGEVALRDFLLKLKNKFVNGLALDVAAKAAANFDGLVRPLEFVHEPEALVPEGFEKFSLELHLPRSGLKLSKLLFNGLDLGLLPPFDPDELHVYSDADHYLPLFLEFLHTTSPGNGEDRVTHSFYAHVTPLGNWVGFSPAVGKLDEAVVLSKLKTLKLKLGKVVALNLGKKEGTYLASSALTVVPEVLLTRHGFAKFVHKAAADVPFTAGLFAYNGAVVSHLPLAKVTSVAVYFKDDFTPVLLDLVNGSAHKFFAVDAHGDWWEDFALSADIRGALNLLSDEQAKVSTLAEKSLKLDLLTTFLPEFKSAGPEAPPVASERLDTFHYVYGSSGKSVNVTVRSRFFSVYDKVVHRLHGDSGFKLVGLKYLGKEHFFPGGDFTAHSASVFSFQGVPLLLRLALESNLFKHFVFNPETNVWTQDASVDNVEEKLDELALLHLSVLPLDLAKRSDYVSLNKGVRVTKFTEGLPNGYEKFVHTHPKRLPTTEGSQEETEANVKLPFKLGSLRFFGADLNLASLPLNTRVFGVSVFFLKGFERPLLLHLKTVNDVPPTPGEGAATTGVGATSVRLPHPGLYFEAHPDGSFKEVVVGDQIALWQKLEEVRSTFAGWLALDVDRTTGVKDTVTYFDNGAEFTLTRLAPSSASGSTPASTFPGEGFVVHLHKLSGEFAPFKFDKLKFSGNDLEFADPSHNVPRHVHSVSVYSVAASNTPLLLGLYVPTVRDGVRVPGFKVFAFEGGKWHLDTSFDTFFLPLAVSEGVHVANVDGGLKKKFLDHLEQRLRALKNGLLNPFLLDLTKTEKYTSGATTVVVTVTDHEALKLKDVSFVPSLTTGASDGDRFTLEKVLFGDEELLGFVFPLADVKSFHLYSLLSGGLRAGVPLVLEVEFGLEKLEYHYFLYNGNNLWKLGLKTFVKLDLHDVLDLVEELLYKFDRVESASFSGLAFDFRTRFTHFSSGKLLEVTKFLPAAGNAVPEGFVLYKYDMKKSSSAFKLKSLTFDGLTYPYLTSALHSGLFAYYKVGLHVPLAFVLLEEGELPNEHRYRWYFFSGGKLAQFAFLTSEESPNPSPNPLDPVVKTKVSEKLTELASGAVVAPHADLRVGLPVLPGSLKVRVKPSDAAVNALLAEIPSGIPRKFVETRHKFLTEKAAFEKTRSASTETVTEPADLTAAKEAYESALAVLKLNAPLVKGLLPVIQKLSDRAHAVGDLGQVETFRDLLAALKKVQDDWDAGVLGLVVQLTQKLTAGGDPSVYANDKLKVEDATPKAVSNGAAPLGSFKVRKHTLNRAPVGGVAPTFDLAGFESGPAKNLLFPGLTLPLKGVSEVVVYFHDDNLDDPLLVFFVAPGVLHKWFKNLGGSWHPVPGLVDKTVANHDDILRVLNELLRPFVPPEVLIDIKPEEGTYHVIRKNPDTYEFERFMHIVSKKENPDGLVGFTEFRHGVAGLKHFDIDDFTVEDPNIDRSAKGFKLEDAKTTHDLGGSVKDVKVASVFYWSLLKVHSKVSGGTPEEVKEKKTSTRPLLFKIVKKNGEVLYYENVGTPGDKNWKKVPDEESAKLAELGNLQRKLDLLNLVLNGAVVIDLSKKPTDTPVPPDNGVATIDYCTCNAHPNTVTPGHAHVEKTLQVSKDATDPPNLGKYTAYTHRLKSPSGQKFNVGRFVDGNTNLKLPAFLDVSSVKVHMCGTKPLLVYFKSTDSRAATKKWYKNESQNWERVRSLASSNTTSYKDIVDVLDTLESNCAPPNVTIDLYNRGGVGENDLYSYKATNSTQLIDVKGTIVPNASNYTEYKHELRGKATEQYFVVRDFKHNGESVMDGLVKAHRVLDIAVYYWTLKADKSTRPLLVKITYEGTVTKWYKNNNTPKSNRWVLLDVNLEVNNLKAKLDEVNHVVNNVITVDISKTGTGTNHTTYCCTPESNGQGVDRIKVQEVQNTALLKTHKAYEHLPNVNATGGELSNFNISEFTKGDTLLKINGLGLPAVSASKVTVFMCEQDGVRTPLLIHVNSSTLENKWFKSTDKGNTWNPIVGNPPPNSTSYSHVVEVLDDLVSPCPPSVTIKLDKRDTDSLYDGGSNKKIRVAKNDRNPDGFTEYTHSVPERQNTYFTVGGFHYGQQLAVGLRRTERVVAVSVYYWTNLENRPAAPKDKRGRPLLLKLTLHDRDPLYYENVGLPGDKTWAVWNKGKTELKAKLDNINHKLNKSVVIDVSVRPDLSGTGTKDYEAGPDGFDPTNNLRMKVEKDTDGSGKLLHYEVYNHSLNNITGVPFHVLSFTSTSGITSTPILDLSSVKVYFCGSQPLLLYYHSSGTSPHHWYKKGSNAWENTGSPLTNKPPTSYDDILGVLDKLNTSCAPPSVTIDISQKGTSTTHQYENSNKQINVTKVTSDTTGNDPPLNYDRYDHTVVGRSSYFKLSGLVNGNVNNFTRAELSLPADAVTLVSAYYWSHGDVNGKPLLTKVEYITSKTDPNSKVHKWYENTGTNDNNTQWILVTEPNDLSTNKDNLKNKLDLLNCRLNTAVELDLSQRPPTGASGAFKNYNSSKQTGPYNTNGKELKVEDKTPPTGLGDYNAFAHSLAGSPEGVFNVAGVKSAQMGMYIGTIGGKATPGAPLASVTKVTFYFHKGRLDFPLLIYVEVPPVGGTAANGQWFQYKAGSWVTLESPAPTSPDRYKDIVRILDSVKSSSPVAGAVVPSPAVA